MNVIEQALAADLLLWGRFNPLWATLFCVVVGVRALGDRDGEGAPDAPPRTETPVACTTA